MALNWPHRNLALSYRTLTQITLKLRKLQRKYNVKQQNYEA